MFLSSLFILGLYFINIPFLRFYVTANWAGLSVMIQLVTSLGDVLRMVWYIE